MRRCQKIMGGSLGLVSRRKVSMRTNGRVRTDTDCDFNIGNPNGRGGTNAWKKHESRIEKDREEAFDAGVGIGEGTRVMVVLKGVTQAMGLTLTKAANSFPPVLFSLFPHEHKMTVLNFTVTRNTEYNGSVRSKVSFVPFSFLCALTNHVPGPADSLYRAQEVTR